MSITNLHPAVGSAGPRLESSTIILCKMEPYLVVARRAKGPFRVVLAMFTRPEDMVARDNDGRVIMEEVIAWERRNFKW